MKYIIGSRGSRLALIQTKYVQERLAKAYPEHTFEIQIIKTKGDKIQNKPLDKIGGKGLFVKEIEEKIRLPTSANPGHHFDHAIVHAFHQRIHVFLSFELHRSTPLH